MNCIYTRVHIKGAKGHRAASVVSALVKRDVQGSSINSDAGTHFKLCDAALQHSQYSKACLRLNACVPRLRNIDFAFVVCCTAPTFRHLLCAQVPCGALCAVWKRVAVHFASGELQESRLVTAYKNKHKHLCAYIQTDIFVFPCKAVVNQRGMKHYRDYTATSV